MFYYIFYIQTYETSKLILAKYATFSFLQTFGSTQNVRWIYYHTDVRNGRLPKHCTNNETHLNISGLI